MGKNQTVKPLYFKLGKKASSFFDPVTRLKLTPGIPAEVKVKDARNSAIIKRGLNSGHIIEIRESEYKEMVGELKEKGVKMPKTKVITEKIVVHTPEKKSDDELDEMNADELRVHAVKFAGSSKEIQKVLKMKTDELITFIQEKQGEDIQSNSKESEESDEDDEDDEEKDTTDDEDEDEDTEDEDDEDK